jgi:Protein of unknown function (DUF1203)
MTMLRYFGLGAAQFQPLFAMDDAALAARGIVRATCDVSPGFPCRITLEDAEPGETLLLLTFRHHDTTSPYRAEGPIFVREKAVTAYDSNTAPPVFRGRTLSVRAYDAAGMMVAADVTDGGDAETLCETLLARPDVAYLHVHNAKPGCFAARVERG